VAYSPFGQNKFPSAKSARGRVLKEIADAHGATPPQVALRFLLRRQITFAIPKASSLKHVEENAGAGSLQLNEAELAPVEKAFPLAARPRRLPTL
jgi:diketogulonate reductase-like aldo/keto reductase